MAQLNGNSNARMLYYALAHHARALEPMVSLLALAYAVELRPLGWDLRPIRKGANSFVLQKDGKQYHLRAGMQTPGGTGYDRIDVKNRYHNGKIVAKLDTRLDVLSFVEARVKES